MIYKNKGKNALVEIQHSKINDIGMLEYTIEYSSGKKEKVSREYLSLPDNPDIASIPIQIPALKEAVRQLTEKELGAIVNPQSLSPAEQELLEMHQ